LIISSLFPYFNLFVSIFIQSYVNNNLHVSTLYVLLLYIGSTHVDIDHMTIRDLEDYFLFNCFFWGGKSLLAFYNVYGMIHAN